jgi:hypothetical protein
MLCNPLSVSGGVGQFSWVLFRRGYVKLAADHLVGVYLYSHRSVDEWDGEDQP